MTYNIALLIHIFLDFKGGASEEGITAIAGWSHVLLYRLIWRQKGKFPCRL